MAVFAYCDYAKQEEQVDLRRQERATDGTYRETCPYCDRKCYVLEEDAAFLGGDTEWDYLAMCSDCGWWSWKSQYFGIEQYLIVHTARSILKRFAVDSEDAPYIELCRYVTKHNDALLDVSPRKFEELVAAVYSDVLGCRVDFCSYGRHDRGIDVVCVRKESGETSAIQAKRYRRPIELGQIHQFYGALLDADRTNGIFVTSSSFRRGCYSVTERLEERVGIHVDLVDGKKLLDFLALLSERHNAVFCPVWRKPFTHAPDLPRDDPKAWVDLPTDLPQQ